MGAVKHFRNLAFDDSDFIEEEIEDIDLIERDACPLNPGGCVWCRGVCLYCDRAAE